MKTIIYDSTGDKLKVRDYAVDLKVGDDVMWIDKRTKVKDVFYDAAIDTRKIILEFDVKPEDIKES
jgi:hypothetical protein